MCTASQTWSEHHTAACAAAQKGDIVSSIAYNCDSSRMNRSGIVDLRNFDKSRKKCEDVKNVTQLVS